MATVALQSKDHRDLLDIIDNLRSHGISRYVDLPEIVVCGDQSAGKSSVLEAISGMSFPTKDNLCTRFATELIIRRYPTPCIRVSIIPDHARSEGEKETLQKFSPSISPETLNLGEVVEEAKKVMGLTTDNKSFSTDILRFEISGPTQPHLTMVDLPGLFEAGNKEQSEKDAKTVKDLVLGYMKRPRSIILAVVSAKSDFALQKVTKYTRKLDPEGMRTLGLITKPDTLDRGSESEMSYIQLAQNKDVKFRLGWHVLKNRSYDMRGATAAKRDEAEAQFFATGIWSSLDPSQVGVESLKSRLSNVLKDQILLQLPSLLEDIEVGIQECKDKLGRLGESRNTTEEQRRYLGRMSQDFSSLMKDAIDGIYTDSFFGSAMTAVGYRRRLRAVISNTLSDFEENMHKHGKSKRIVEEVDGSEQNQVSRSQFIDEVKSLMRRSRGRELPGTFNPLIVGELFSDQCRPWKRLVAKLTSSVVKSVYATINELLQHTAVEETSDGIFREIISPEMEVLKSNLQDKVNELLAPHHSSHPITYNRYLTDNVQRAQASRRREEIAKILQGFLNVTDLDNSSQQMQMGCVNPTGMLDSLVEISETDMERYASSAAIDYMEAYYKVALEKFIDDISVLAVERCLIQKLPFLFSPETVSRLQNPNVGKLAGESDESSAERSRLSEKLNALEQGLRSLKVLDKHQSKDISEDVYVNPLKRKASGTEIRREV
ncbi:hypothetical protein DTO207G8_2159 [Paecilomyces variotii]|nr:hypothetical protein DTO207G8_2159 [Paecilomyces variotii]